mgnify:CR=1 FL=1
MAQRSPVIDMLMGSTIVKVHMPLALDELNDEAVTLLIAGSDTTSNSMLCGIYRICSDIPVHDSLVGELQAAFPSLDTSITYEQAKGLPYLVRKLYSSLSRSFKLIELTADGRHQGNSEVGCSITRKTATACPARRLFATRPRFASKGTSPIIRIS